MTQRLLCQTCSYPLRTCVCCAIAPISSLGVVDILQHPSEQKAAKNTARLVALCLAQSRIWVGEKQCDFAELQAQLAGELRPIAIVYPGTNSQPLESFIGAQTNARTESRGKNAKPIAVRFLFLDGTWKKAYKLWQLNPWLQQYPLISIEATASQYHIRKAPKEHYLSTIEAIAICLQKAEYCNVQPLYDCLHQMQLSFSEPPR